MTNRDNCQIAVYYFPNYHVDPRNEQVHGKGWTEWELVRAARPRFAGHQQPKVPLWGCQDESDPSVFSRKIDAAADAGITSFIFDWYWYDDGPFLHRALENGYLRAPNNQRLRFSLMWANHDRFNIHPASRLRKPPPLYPGAVTAETFDALTDHVIENYMTHPSYWILEGRPYFSIYELYRLIESLGGVEATRHALTRFEDKAHSAGLAGLHLNAVDWGVRILPGEQAQSNPNQLLRRLGFRSVTSYVWIHDVGLKDFPVTDYREVMRAVAGKWPATAGGFSMSYFPNVTMGWDPSPRARADEEFTNAGYPFMPTLGGNTPDAFASALQAARDFLSGRSQPRVVTINAWNEWTEGSYLEPDTLNKMAYLQAIRSTFE